MEFEKWSLAFHKVLFLSSKMNFPIYIALGNYAGMAPNYCICNYRELCKYLLGMLVCINVRIFTRKINSKELNTIWLQMHRVEIMYVRTFTATVFFKKFRQINVLLKNFTIN